MNPRQSNRVVPEVPAGVPIMSWGRSLWLDATMSVIALWTPIVMLVMIVGSCWWTTGEAHRHSVHAASAAIGAATLGRLLNEPLARWVNKPRPFETVFFVPLVSHEQGQALPSNHATGAFALAVGMTPMSSVQGLLLVLAVCLCVSRVYCGVHDVFDVAAGAVHGGLLGWICAAL